MKSILVLALVLILAACSKSPPPVTTDAERPATPAPPPAPAPAPTSTPPPAAVAATPAPQPGASPKLAPAGVFYLITTVRFESPGGPITLKPGTGVKLIRPGTYLTPAGERPLREDSLTNNMDVARAARDADLAATATLRGTPAPITPAAPPLDNSQATAALAARQRAQDTLTLLNRQKAALEAQIQALLTKRNKMVGGALDNKRANTGPIDLEIAGVRSQLAALSTQITEAQRTLR